jgi:hypothetical protein
MATSDLEDSDSGMVPSSPKTGRVAKGFYDFVEGGEFTENFASWHLALSFSRDEA